MLCETGSICWHLKAGNEPIFGRKSSSLGFLLLSFSGNSLWVPQPRAGRQQSVLLMPSFLCEVREHPCSKHFLRETSALCFCLHAKCLRVNLRRIFQLPCTKPALIPVKTTLRKGTSPLFHLMLPTSVQMLSSLMLTLPIQPSKRICYREQ